MAAPAVKLMHCVQYDSYGGGSAGLKVILHRPFCFYCLILLFCLLGGKFIVLEIFNECPRRGSPEVLELACASLFDSPNFLFPFILHS